MRPPRPTFDTADWEPEWKRLEGEGYVLAISMHPGHTTVFVHSADLERCWMAGTVAGAWEQAVEANKELKEKAAESCD